MAESVAVIVRCGAVGNGHIPLHFTAPGLCFTHATYFQRDSCQP